MKINLNMRKNFYIFLLVCLGSSPMVALAEVSQSDVSVDAPVVVVAEEAAAQKSPQRLSETLKSPRAEDLLLYAQSMPYNLVQSGSFYPVMSNRGFLSPVDMQQMCSAEEMTKKRARFSLFKDLQFTNHAHLKSIVGGFNPKTQAGKLALENLFASENTDWELTKNRQTFIKALVDSPALLAHLQNTLGLVRDSENLGLAKFAPVHPALAAASNMASNMMYAQFQMVILLYGFIPEYRNTVSLKGLASAEAVLAAVFAYHKYLAPKIAKLDAPSNIVNFFTRVGSALIPLQLLKYATYDLFYKKSGPLYWLSQKAFINNNNAPSWQGRSLLALYALAAAAGLGYLFVSGYKQSSNEFAEMNGVSQFITASAQLRDAILSDEKTADAYKNAFGEMSESWKELEGRAANHKNSAGPSWLCTNNSNINNMAALMKQTAADVARSIQFYGEIDAYTAVAQFIVDHKLAQNNLGEPIHTCFTEFIENSEESILDVTNVWHPLIPVDSVRANSIKLGGSVATPRNAVVTGPNAAGKSVNLKALLVNLMMAQTFGVACAESFKFTPFTKIIGRLNAPDDTASGHSKFMLEAMDVVNLLTQLKSLKPNEHAFVVTDELFSGTEVGPAIELSKQLCGRIGSMKNVIYILATHYKDLVTVKKMQNASFENYKVSVTKQADGTLNYPYKLTHGIGNTNVAFDIFLQQMEQQGLGDQDLKNMVVQARTNQEAIEKASGNV